MIKYMILGILILLIIPFSQAQNVYSDTIKVNSYFQKAETFSCDENYDSAIFYFNKTIALVNSSEVLNLNLSIWTNTKYLSCLNNITSSYISQKKLDKAIIFADSVINQSPVLIGENTAIEAYALFLKGVAFYKLHELDNSIEYLSKSLSIRIIIYGQTNKDVANCYNNLGIIFYEKGEYQKSLDYLQKVSKIRLQLFGDNSIETANSYNNLGLVYEANGEYESALSFYQKALNIFENFYGQDYHLFVNSYNSLGILYFDKGEYDKALENYQIALNYSQKLPENNNNELAKLYNNFANVYKNKAEYDKALEFYDKALNFQMNILGENSIDVAYSYNNIGIVYNEKGEYDKAIDFYKKALDIEQKIFGPKNPIVASSFNNIGIAYFLKGEYSQSTEFRKKSLSLQKPDFRDKSLNLDYFMIDTNDTKYNKPEFKMALEYFDKSLSIRLLIFGENHSDLAQSYNNIGSVFKDKGIYDKALIYYQKALDIQLKNYGTKNLELAYLYNNIADVYSKNNQADKALLYYQKALCSNLTNLNDTVNVYSVPQIKNYLDWNILLKSMQGKIDILSNSSNKINNISFKNRLLLAIEYYKSSDTLISQVRNQITSQSDKIALGQKANEIYNDALELCVFLNQVFKSSKDIKKYSELAFYFSEKNKTSVLLQSMQNTEALKFSGIPENLLKNEHNFKIDIANYSNRILVCQNDSIKNLLTAKLFSFNRSYDSLISTFEKQYPKYYQLKFTSSTAKINEIKKLIDAKTAMISYSISDKFLTVFIITKNNFLLKQLLLPIGLNANILKYRSAISDLSLIKEDIQNNTSITFNYQIEEANILFNLLFPDEINAILKKNKIKNIIIIPDGELVALPFETLLTQKFETIWNGWKNSSLYFSNMPYLIKDYNISYNYSATLFEQIENRKKKNSKNVAKYDLIAFAPVFDDYNTASIVASSRKMFEQKDSTVNYARSFLNGNYICPLLGTKDEVNEIFDLFEKDDKTAEKLMYGAANEQAIKLEQMKDYKIIHLATHGTVNELTPELSAVLLAQNISVQSDSLNSELGNIVQQDEGILFVSEIYNLSLNADLVVLSACETGLGKVSKGEGLMGISRAFIYAGTYNLIVSLWSVSDKATQQLMVDFYKDLLNQKNQTNFSTSLRNAKLLMIEQGKHPYLWSPFILIGE